MFNTNKEVKRRLSILLAFVMVLSLCSGFGFTKSENVLAAENTVTAGNHVLAASGSASVPTGPSVTVTPTPTIIPTVAPTATPTPEPTSVPTVTPTVTPEDPTGLQPIWWVSSAGDYSAQIDITVYDSEGNVITKAKPGDVVTVKLNPDCEYAKRYKHGGFEVFSLLEDYETNWDDCILRDINEEDPSYTCTFTVPEFGASVWPSFTTYYLKLGNWVTVTNIEGVHPERLEFVLDDCNEYGMIASNVTATIEAAELYQREFVRWEVVSGDVELADPTSPVTTFTMPKENVEIKARYKSTSEYEVIWQRDDQYADFIWAEDSEGNRIKEAKKGDLITIRVNPYGEYLQSNDWMLTGLYIEAFAEDLNSRGEVLVDMYNLEKVPRSFTLVMPEFGINGLSFYFRRGGYWNNLNISNGKFTKVDGMTLQEANFNFKGKMLVGGEVTVEADNIADAIFVKWASDNDEVKFADPYARTTTFVMPKSDVKVYALYEYYEVPAPSIPSQPSTPDSSDKEDASGTQSGSSSATEKEDSSKPEEEKNPDVITEQDVYTEEEQAKLAEFKLPQVAEEVQEKVEVLVQAIQNMFFKVSEEVKEKLAENITLGTAPATENSLATALNNNPVDLMSKSLSFMEQKRIEAGEKLNMYMEVKDATETVSEAEKTLVEKMVEDISAILNEGKAEGSERKTELGMYLDLNLMKQIGNDKAKKVVRPKGKIDVSIQVPENLLNKDANVQRVYQIICVQNGKSVLLDAEFNVKTNALSFKTDKFATFALIYTDVPVEKKVEK